MFIRNLLNVSVCSLALLAGISGFAQTTDQTSGTAPAATVPTPSAAPVQDTNAKPVDSSSEPERYAVSLDGTGAILLEKNARRQFFYGTTGSYMADISTEEGQRRNFGVITPFLGMRLDGQRTDWIFQYSPTMGFGDSNDTDHGVFHRGTTSLTTELTRRLFFEASATVSSGDQIARLFAPVTTGQIGNVVAIDPNAANFEFGPTRVFGLDTSARVSYALSPRSSWSFSFRDFYYARQDISSRVDLIQTNYEKAVNRRLTLGVYALTNQMHDTTVCSTYGGGASISLVATQRILINGEAGPQGGCGTITGQFRGAVYGRLSRYIKAYIEASRSPNSFYLGSARWEDTARGGISKQFGRITNVSADGGLSRADGVDASGVYRGYFASGTFAQKLMKSLFYSVNYRHYFRKNNFNKEDNDLIMFSIGWTPTPGHVLR